MSRGQGDEPSERRVDAEELTLLQNHSMLSVTGTTTVLSDNSQALILDEQFVGVCVLSERFFGPYWIFEISKQSVLIKRMLSPWF